MLSTVDLLDAARHRQGDVSDYRLSKLLGVPPTTVSNYRVGRSLPANPIAMRLGTLAGVDPVEDATVVNLERATTPEEREFWQNVLARVAPTKKARHSA